jgi:hypothetical protein
MNGEAAARVEDGRFDWVGILDGVNILLANPSAVGCSAMQLLAIPF